MQGAGEAGGPKAPVTTALESSVNGYSFRWQPDLRAYGGIVPVPFSDPELIPECVQLEDVDPKGLAHQQVQRAGQRLPGEIEVTVAKKAWRKSFSLRQLF